MSLKIAMLGTRGLPATFGGVEHHVEQIGELLVERGHEVTVYSESHYTDTPVTEHRGMRVVTLPSVPVRGFEALAHSAMATAHGLMSGHDVFHYHAVGPGLLSPLARFGSRSAIVQTVHGLDADRAKWGGGARRVLNLATWLSAKVPDATVTVSRALADHYAARYERACNYVPNGVSIKPSRKVDLIRQRYGLEGDDYFLFVGRLVPEKRPDLLLKAFAKVSTDKKLVLVGGSSHTDDYVEELRRLAAQDPRVIMPGYLYGAELDELFTNATAFVQPSTLEGLPLTLLEAVGSGLPVIVSDIEPHVEIVTEDRAGARVFRDGDVDGLTNALRRVDVSADRERAAARNLRSAVISNYDWSACVDSLEVVYHQAVNRVGGPRRRAARPQRQAALLPAALRPGQLEVALTSSAADSPQACTPFTSQRTLAGSAMRERVLQV